ncbi:penicillin-binding protein 2 [Thioalkalivibrio sp.]|uniref:penicillin-binding protein 2 n=1 Tax=Thioalkalivibrio sp. TaxID=2093813 RepID=UPI0012D66408|nr:penicillin-binding protein 2 [Thioalkalivibrio sp.]TVP82920.1 MAG: penicillin-binding protein 2 [Thioalkalivibrio sp.]
MERQDSYNEEGRDQSRFSIRVLVSILVLLLLVLLLVGRMFTLQVGAHAHFTTLSENNRLRIEPIPPTRGLIYDRNGILLAENRPAYQLEVTVEQAGDLELLLERLSGLVDLSPAEIDRFRASVRQRRPFQPVLLKSGLDDETVARIAVARHELPGVEIEARPVRHYPHGADFAHVVGYVGRINEQDLRRLDTRNYAGTSHTGKTGVERHYEDVLHGTTGHKQVEVNAQGRVIRELSVVPPVPGQDLFLSIDAGLQRAARDALAPHDGAVVAIDPATGEVLALVSKPGFDPNPFVHGISHRDFSALQSDPHKPLFNRALSGQYPPGSTLKPIVALAGLEENVTTAERRMFATGYYQLPGYERRYRDWRRGGHGWVDMNRAIAVSSDVYFYDLGHKLGIDRMAPMLGAFGIGSRVGIDATGERPGILPSREWKRSVQNLQWFPGETLITAIGQGYMLTTPLQLADVTSTLANRGQRVQTRLVRAIRDGADGEPLAKPLRYPDPVIASDAHWDVIHQALIDAVHARHGTAWGSIGSTAPAYRIAGKTGTAQVFSLAPDQEYDESELDRRLWDHALFIGYAPADAPEIAVAVLAEHGGSGGRVAAPIARRVMDAYLTSLGLLAETEEQP